MTQIMVGIDPIQTRGDLEWCARILASNDPWRTLRRDFNACMSVLSNEAKERYVIRADGERAGVLILDMHGPFAGYLQTIGLDAAFRNRGIGRAAIAWAETRIFRDSPNVFMCVSSFNPDARRLYARLGYETVGVLTGFAVSEHDEWLLRKSRGSWEQFQTCRPASQ